MIGYEDDNEEVQYKVADKRKFNSDGSLREGVTLAAEKTVEETITDSTVVAAPEPATNDIGLEDEFSASGNADDDSAEIPGADDPASFVNFLSSLATNAAAALGAVPHPATGQRSLDLDSAKYWLDILSMLRDKTKGNLHQQENRLLEGLLGDLKMQYVHLIRATEEKLKAQAAAKFSGDEILGKKV